MKLPRAPLAVALAFGAMLAAGRAVDETKPYALACVTVVDAREGKESELGGGLKPRAGLRLTVHLDANAEGEALIVALTRKTGQLAHGWRPALVRLKEWAEVTAPPAGEPWVWTEGKSEGSGLEFRIHLEQRTQSRFRSSAPPMSSFRLSANPQQYAAGRSCFVLASIEPLRYGGVMHSRSPASRFALRTLAGDRLQTRIPLLSDDFCRPELRGASGAESCAGWRPNVHAQAPARYSWQEPQARVLPTGGLQWTPKPFVFEKGESMRYIDFDEPFAGGGN